MSATIVTRTWQQLTRANRLAPYAALVLLATCCAALLSLIWLPHDPNFADASRLWQAPSITHPLGTDGSGRDLLSQLLAGSRIALIVAAVTGAGSALLSILLAGLAVRGPAATALAASVLIDVLIAFPTLLLAMLLAAVFGSGIGIVLTALIFGFGFSLSRVIRGEIAQAAETDYVLAARMAGVSSWTIFWRHCVRPATPVLITQTALAMGLAVLAESNLTYLGFGLDPATPSWGRMLAQTQQAASVYPLAAAVPGLTITIFALACFILGDALRQITDPRLGRRPQAKADTTQPADAITAAEADATAQARATGNTDATTPLLSVRDLWVHDHTGNALLKGVNLDLALGERLAIIGRSGSGKSLTALTIAGLLAPGLKASGSIKFAGQELLTLTETELAQMRGAEIGYVFQEPKTALHPLRKLGRQMSAALAHHYELSAPARKQRELALAAQVGLDAGLLQRYPHQVSGGQRQRAAIAAALSANPRLLIADEVTSALDSRVRAQILTLLRELTAADNRSLIFISHDLAQVRTLVDRVIVIGDGAIAEDRQTAELFADPHHPLTAALLAASAPELGAEGAAH